MRTHIVVLAPEPVQDPLLSPTIRLGRANGLFQRTVHALVPSVLLRMSRLDSLWHNPQLDPPHRKPRQAGDRTRCKGRAIIGADGPGHTVLAKRRLEDRL